MAMGRNFPHRPSRALPWLLSFVAQEQPICRPTPDRAPMLREARAAAPKLARHHPPHRSDLMVPHAGVTLRIEGLGTVAVELDLSPRRRISNQKRIRFYPLKKFEQIWDSN
jgi:hypothetical protein